MGCRASKTGFSECQVNTLATDPHTQPHIVIKILDTSLIVAQIQVLSAALRATQLDSTCEPESRETEGLNEEPVSDPSPVSDNHILLSASSSQNELSMARILQSTVSTCPVPQPSRM